MHLFGCRRGMDDYGDKDGWIISRCTKILEDAGHVDARHRHVQRIRNVVRQLPVEARACSLSTAVLRDQSGCRE